ncbi:fasciclin domain-containing protein [Rhodococcus sp. X156]|uniref:fasciclin domain-containing protein n=1 Tax=Rhodococcus sp. X156 TaxID=2499145 RepID=UPI000FDA3C36|nr:fasciclin domain-containing protein [Rhodococcus sp. X156]
MRKTQRLAAVGALAALTLSIAACSNSEEASTETTSAAPTTSAAASSSGAPSSAAAAASSSGVTTVADIFGPACSSVPKTGPGSPEGMVNQPVATAASANPLFSTLVTAVKAAGLVDTLNKPDAAYTVFAPTDAAFAALPAGTLDTLLKDPKGDLTKILTYHVVPQRYDAAGLVKAGSVKSVEGESVTITGTAQAPLINRVPVACGNIPTANATVFAIGQVLMPPAMK